MLSSFRIVSLVFMCIQKYVYYFGKVCFFTLLIPKFSIFRILSVGFSFKIVPLKL